MGEYREFENVIGYEDVKAELIRICDVLRFPDKYKKLGVVSPRGVMLYGDPGIGKTLLAKSFIKECGRTSFIIRKDKPNGAFVDEIREIFTKAGDEAPSIVLLDDLDKFANEDCYHKDAEEYVAVQSCIDGLKEKEVFVIATVNDKSELPESLMRAGRFDKVIEMRNPQGEDAEKIIRFYLKGKKTVADVDTGEIARIMDGRSCAELEAVINEAGIYAAYSGKDLIEQEDIIKACMRVIFNAPECINPKEVRYLDKIAVHEAGHTVTSEILEPGSVNLVSVQRYSGNVEGFTDYKRNEDSFMLRETKECEIIRLLGGRAAVEIVYGTIDMGSETDLSKAFAIEQKHIDDICLFGFDTYDDITGAEILMSKRSAIIANEIERLYLEAKKILADNRSFLDNVAADLLARQTLTCKDIAAIRDRIS